MKACIVTGTRHGLRAEWFPVIHEALRGYDVVIEGGAPGIDFIAGGIADAMGIKHTEIKADWLKHGKSAGPKRNQLMLDELLSYARTDGADISVLAFHSDLANSKGTGDMVRRAKAAGVDVRVYS